MDISTRQTPPVKPKRYSVDAILPENKRAVDKFAPIMDKSQ